MNALDSRSLGIGDCYVRHFIVPATPVDVYYRLFRAPSIAGRAPSGSPFTMHLRERDIAAHGESQQHNVTVRVHEGRLIADPGRLEIDDGDSVCWFTDEPRIRFAVGGDLRENGFDSTALTDNSAYSHRFLSDGTYRWVDAFNGDLSGEVVVTNPDIFDEEQLQRWNERLREASIVRIDGRDVDPAKVEVMTGQTVTWVVIRGERMTISDARLASQA